LFAIDAHSDLGAFAGDDEMIPLANRFGGISAGREGIVECAVIMLAEFCFACAVHHLNFKPALHRILRVRTEKDAAVAPARHLYLQIQNKISKALFRPNIATARFAYEYAILHRPSILLGLPTVEIFTIKQRHKPFRRPRLQSGDSGKRKQRDEKNKGVLHGQKSTRWGGGVNVF